MASMKNKVVGIALPLAVVLLFLLLIATDFVVPTHASAHRFQAEDDAAIHLLSEAFVDDFPKLKGNTKCGKACGSDADCEENCSCERHSLLDDDRICMGLCCL